MAIVVALTLPGGCFEAECTRRDTMAAGGVKEMVFGKRNLGLYLG